MAAQFKSCSVSGCNRSALRRHSGKRGFCSMHYSRWLKHGDTSKVLETPSPAKDWIELHKNHTGDECLIWPFAIGKDGYGRVHRPNDGSLTTAANLMCEAAHGERPSSKHESAHSCGNGHEGCINPRHLRWATPIDNHADKIEHGTTNRGERQGGHKLTEKNVRAIRTLLKSMTQSDIARMFGVNQTTINNIKTRKRWGWLD